VTRPTVSDTLRWQPSTLLGPAQDWDDAARRLCGRVEDVTADADRSRDYWFGAAADAARERARRITAETAAVARRLVMASVAARDGAHQMTTARDAVVSHVEQARREGFAVDDSGLVTVGADPVPLLVLLAGGQDGPAEEMLEVRASELSTRIRDALERLGIADADAAADITAALRTTVVDGVDAAARTTPAGAGPVDAVGVVDVVDGWPVMSQDRIAAQIAAMTAEQRDRLVAEFPDRVGNTDGVPWDMRFAANRRNIAAAILAEPGTDEGSRRRTAFYRSLLGEVDDPAGGGRIHRKIVAFDPARSLLVELNGDLETAHGVAVLVPGVNTTIEGSAANTATARRFVTGGDVAVITFLGGPFPQVHNPAAALLEAADPKYALDMAPRLVAFTEDLDRRVGAEVPVTVLGHSYGGSIVGTAETLGLTSDRTVFLAAAGAGVGVDGADDWHNRNPGVVRFSLTAPDDFIELVQGIPGGPHGADPDEIAGVIHLPTGRYDDGTQIAGWDAHSGMLNRPGDSWRMILGIIAGDIAADSPAVRAAG
jgi:uncharacterized protein YukE